MTMIAPQAKIDPLHVFIAGARNAETERPVPLVATHFDVSIDGGLAIVSTRRTFRNDESESIEATITFPVPVHAVLFALEARIGGRVLKARAQSKSRARESYEEAIERGKTAVLHEEVFRGVHMLSVGHIPAGAEIEVSAVWALTLTNVNDRGRLRIPSTVGDIYGRSDLPDSDDLIHGGAEQFGELTVRCRDGSVTLLGGTLDAGRARVPLNAPIDLDVADWAPRDLRGRAADGREVILRVEPNATDDGALDLAVLIDHSGSMGEICTADGSGLTKHQAILAGLRSIAGRLNGSDIIDLWEFSNSVNHVGTTNERKAIPLLGSIGSRNPERGLLGLVSQLSPPGGGTEIGGALAHVVAQSEARDVMLITDGKSHALDVQALARTGRRFSVVLVGEDSLEANVGHLAALTGGDIFVAAGADLADAMVSALDSLRVAHLPQFEITDKPHRVSVRRSGMALVALWRAAEAPIEETMDARAVAALAASLVLPALDSEAAANLAEAEGLVTHLTSLVLVDEATAVQEGIPATRKIALPTPRALISASAPLACMDPLPSGLFERAQSRGNGYDMKPKVPRSSIAIRERRLSPPRTPAPAHIDLSLVGAKINWDAAPTRLQHGDLSWLDAVVAAAIREAATIAEVAGLAKRLTLDPVILVVGLIARAWSSRNRSAARIAKAILGRRSGGGIARAIFWRQSPDDLDRVAEMLHLG